MEVQQTSFSPTRQVVVRTLSGEQALCPCEGPVLVNELCTALAESSMGLKLAQAGLTPRLLRGTTELSPLSTEPVYADADEAEVALTVVYPSGPWSEALPLVNQVRPGNVDESANRLACIEVASIGGLEQVAQVIFFRALAEPARCSVLVDLVLALCRHHPGFGKLPAEREGDPPHTLRRALVDACQVEFETLAPSPESSGEDLGQAGKVGERRARLAAFGRLVGHLFLRELLAVRVIRVIVQGLLGSSHARSSSAPLDEVAVECAVELLMVAGPRLDILVDTGGRALVTQCFARLEAPPLTPGTRGWLLFQDLRHRRAKGWAVGSPAVAA